MWATSATYVGCVLGSTRVPHRTLIQSWDIEHGWMGEWDISHLSHLSLPACKAPWASLDPVYLQYLTWRRKAAETSTKTPFIPAVDYFHSCSQEGGPGVSGPALTLVPDTWTVTQPDHIHMKQPWTVTQCSCLLAVITFPSANTPHAYEVYVIFGGCFHS